MYQPISSQSYNGLGQFWGEQTPAKIVDPSTMIPKKAKRISASEGGQLLYRSRALRHYKNRAHGVSDDIYWTAAGPLWSTKPVKVGKKTEAIQLPTGKEKTEIKIVRDAPTLNLPPVELSGLDLANFSLRDIATAIGLGVAGFAVTWYLV